jgi:hypothetical protein
VDGTEDAISNAMDSMGSNTSRRGVSSQQQQQQPPPPPPPTPLSNNSSSGGGGVPENFVTQPPRQAVKGLTGKISTLFRRESSRERNAAASAAAAAASSATLDDDDALALSMAASSSYRRMMMTTSSRSGGGLGRSTSPTLTTTSTTHMAAALARENRSARSRSVDSRAELPYAQQAAAAQVPTTTSRMMMPRRNSGDVSVSARSVQSVRSRSSKRIFYSSHDDDDDDDDSDHSYNSRASRQSATMPRGRTRSSMGGSRDTVGTSNEAASDVSRSLGTSMTTGEYSSYTELDGESVKVIKRFRGFSTSIKSFFLDESLVCGAFGCFGLILSNRTEYLLQLRNERRGAVSAKNRAALEQRRKMPSRIIATGLVFMLLLMFTTFVIWGFGTGNGVVGDYLNGYDYYDDKSSQQDQWDDYLSSNGYNANGNKNYNSNNGDDRNENENDDANQADAANDDANQAAANDDGQGRDLERLDSHGNLGASSYGHHGLHGVFKIRDYQENLWDPLVNLVRNEWYRDDVDSLSTPHGRQRRIDEATDEASAEQEAQDESSSIPNSYQGYRKRRDLASDIRLALLIVFLLFLGVLGRRRRMRTRFYLVRARAQEDHLFYASADETASRRVALDDSREDQYEGACSHTLCGCYPVDEVGMVDEIDESVEVVDKGIFKRKKKPHQEDIVARMFNCFMATCCGVACKCWLQCLSICALAQEAREVRLLIPPRYQRIDYITHQPFHEYQEAVNDLRRGWLGKARRVSGIVPHYNALSRLSRYVLILSMSAILIIVATLVFNPRAAFSWQDAVVLVATFLQSFLVLFCVHWIFHKSDLSLDAVIKMFAAGFLIAVPTAFFFEGLLVNVMLSASYSLYFTCVSVFGDSFADWVDVHWRAIWIVAELFNAYIVAAVTEELCKYYTFRAVEHPDLIFLTGLQREVQDETAVDGGLVKYPFASHQVQKLARQQSFNDDCSVSDRSHRSSRSHRSRSFSREKPRRKTLIEKTGTRESEYDEDELDARTRRQKAMAITTGMISVAVGLACAENFLYVFVLGGALGDNPEESRRGDFLEAWIVLFFRSIFPVHALAAAMQSINMIRKFVELDEHNGHRVGVGRIIFPAVVIHGSFDAVLMGINVFVETAWNNNNAEDNDAEPYNALAVNLVAWSSITAIMIGGLFWYYRENRKQGARLKVLEEQDKALQAEEWIAGAESRDLEDRLV